MYTSTLQHPPNSQYDPDSAPDQNFNCGPTTVTNVSKFYRDRDFGIEETRRLATSSHSRGTTVSERKLMMSRRGVPCSVLHLTPTQVKAKLDGKRSMDLALLMSKIPLAIRKRPFTGSHSVEAIAKGVVNGLPGIWVNNPDFHRDRGEPSRYFYADRYWIPAYDALGRFCVVPDKDKVITTRRAYVRKLRTTSGLNARSGPGTSYSIVRVLPSGYVFTSRELETAGGSYTANGVRRRDWVSFSLNGRLVWVARGFTKEI